MRNIGTKFVPDCYTIRAYQMGGRWAADAQHMCGSWAADGQQMGGILAADGQRMGGRCAADGQRMGSPLHLPASVLPAMISGEADRQQIASKSPADREQINIILVPDS